MRWIPSIILLISLTSCNELPSLIEISSDFYRIEVSPSLGHYRFQLPDSENGHISLVRIQAEASPSKIQEIEHPFGIVLRQKVIKFVDYNGDGFTDILLLEDGSSHPNNHFAFYRFDVGKKLFVRDAEPEGLFINQFSGAPTRLTSYGRSGSEAAWMHYEYIEGNLLPVERVHHFYDNEEKSMVREVTIFANGKPINKTRELRVKL